MATGSSDWTTIGTFVGASLAYMPAIGVFIGLVIACFGIIPRAMIALSWFTMVFALLISQLGALLKLPTWLMNLSPFTHISAGPSEEIAMTPLVVLTAISLGLLILGIIALRKRNIITS
jgi:ABC-2 type transport system permease protein